MKAADEIIGKIEEIRTTMDHIEEKRKQELLKPIEKRNHRLLVFLEKEERLYEYGMQQLQWAFE